MHRLSHIFQITAFCDRRALHSCPGSAHLHVIFADFRFAGQYLNDRTNYLVEPEVLSQLRDNLSAGRHHFPPGWTLETLAQELFEGCREKIPELVRVRLWLEEYPALIAEYEE